MRDKPITILVEGANNCGKGTVLHALKKRLLQNELMYLELKQPLKKDNREVLLSGNLDYKEEYKIFKRDREYVHSLLNQIIKENKFDVILLDRNIVSSLSYQSIIPNDYEMLIEITKDASQLYKGLTVDIAIHLETTPEVIANRNNNSTKQDYRDSSDLDVIKKELSAYNIVFNTFLSLGCVNHYMKFDNNNCSDLNYIINEVDNRIIEIIKERDYKYEVK